MAERNPNDQQNQQRPDGGNRAPGQQPVENGIERDREFRDEELERRRRAALRRGAGDAPPQRVPYYNFLLHGSVNHAGGHAVVRIDPPPPADPQPLCHLYDEALIPGPSNRNPEPEQQPMDLERKRPRSSPITVPYYDFVLDSENQSGGHAVVRIDPPPAGPQPPLELFDEAVGPEPSNLNPEQEALPMDLEAILEDSEDFPEMYPQNGELMGALNPSLPRMRQDPRLQRRAESPAGPPPPPPPFSGPDDFDF